MLKEDYIEDIAKTLNLCNYQLAELTRVKEELEQRLAASLEHGDEGQKTYICGKYKIQVTTGFNYTLDKEEYALMKSRINNDFDPVKERIAFDIDKKVIRDNWKYASAQDLLLLNKIIITNPKKLAVKVMAAV